MSQAYSTRYFGSTSWSCLLPGFFCIGSLQRWHSGRSDKGQPICTSWKVRATHTSFWRHAWFSCNRKLSYTSESLLIAKFLTKKNNYTHTGKKKSSLQHLNLCSNYSSLRTHTSTENLLPESSSNFVCFRKCPHQIPELLQSSQRIFFKECQNSLQIQVAFSAFSPSIVGSVPLSKYSRR